MVIRCSAALQQQHLVVGRGNSHCSVYSSTVEDGDWSPSESQRRLGPGYWQGPLGRTGRPLEQVGGRQGFATSSGRNREDSWFKSLFVRKVDPRKDAHANLLTKNEASNLYKIQFHNVKPECLEAYNKLCEDVLPSIHADKYYPCELVGTWNTWYGEQDQAVHLWRYRGGYPALTEVMNKLRQSKEFTAYRKERGKMLLSRRNQLLLEFSFWNEPVPREGPNIYELRSYQLRPGTMIEWGNYWARAIGYRQHNREAVGGFFSQIGNLYMVHHLWAYKDLQSRENTRNAAWQQEGWHEVVYYTGIYIICLDSPHTAYGFQDHDPNKGFPNAMKRDVSWKLK
ncbi:hypothetical protein INR49_017700 [Caranx melampygus]|nr:hypothetical protein INR49_017700 [Caranx melampygus]